MSTEPDDTCRIYEVDGEPVRVHGGESLTAEGQAALGEVVRATIEHVKRTDPNLGIRQELIMATLAAMRCIPDGQIQLEGHCTISNGAKVKARLRAAVVAAREVLTPPEPPS